MLHEFFHLLPTKQLINIKQRDLTFIGDEIFSGNDRLDVLVVKILSKLLENGEQWIFILVVTIFSSRSRFVERELVFSLVQSKHRACIFSYL